LCIQYTMYLLYGPWTLISTLFSVESYKGQWRVEATCIHHSEETDWVLTRPVMINNVRRKTDLNKIVYDSLPCVWRSNWDCTTNNIRFCSGREQPFWAKVRWFLGWPASCRLCRHGLNGYKQNTKRHVKNERCTWPHKPCTHFLSTAWSPCGENLLRGRARTSGSSRPTNRRWPPQAIWTSSSEGRVAATNIYSRNRDASADDQNSATITSERVRHHRRVADIFDKRHW